MNKEKKERLSEDERMVNRATLVHQLLSSINGEDILRDGLLDTPLRVASMYEELFKGYNKDPKQVLRDALFINEGSKDIVLVKDIEFSSTCEHHMMPFFGKVAIAYIPQDGRIVGLSKLARVVDILSKRLQVQERLGSQIADTIEKVMNPRGVAVIIKAEHTCMTVRGVHKPGSCTVTSCLRGAFFLDDKARKELYDMLHY